MLTAFPSATALTTLFTVKIDASLSRELWVGLLLLFFLFRYYYIISFLYSILLCGKVNI